MRLDDPIDAAALLRRAAALLEQSPFRRGSCVRLPARGALLVAGDLHDNPIHLQRLERLARLDQLDRGSDRHLVLHEMIHGDRLVDGVDLSHRMLLRVAQSIERHPTQVHPLLANHEIAQLVRRGVSKGAGDSVKLFNDGLEYVYGDDADEVAAAIDDFIRAMPLALRSEPDGSGRSVFCAHSLPSPQAMRHFDATSLERPLIDADFQAPAGAAYLMTWGRGLDAAHLAALGAKFGATLFCLGHQHAETGIELIAPNTVIVNSDHERGAAIPISLDQVPSAEDAAMESVPLASVADAPDTERNRGGRASSGHGSGNASRPGAEPAAEPGASGER